MTREEYSEKVNGSFFEADILSLYDFFENYLLGERITEPDIIAQIKQEVINYQIKELTAHLMHDLHTNGRKILRSYCNSLYTNIRNFIKEDNDEKQIKIWRVLLLSYINLSRLIVDDDKIQRFLLQPNNSQKIILCVSTIKLDEDDIKVNEEIAHIQELINEHPNTSYLVLPIHGCSFDQFKNRIKSYRITHVHIAGHTINSKTIKIQFSDSGVKFSTFHKYVNEYNRHFEVLFLNCCSTYEYIERTPFPFSDISICHETEVNGITAYDASHAFYTNLFNDIPAEESWNAVRNSIEDNLYHILHS